LPYYAGSERLAEVDAGGTIEQVSAAALLALDELCVGRHARVSDRRDRKPDTGQSAQPQCQRASVRFVVAV
jgi:hypothetical protein